MGTDGFWLLVQLLVGVASGGGFSGYVAVGYAEVCEGCCYCFGCSSCTEDECFEAFELLPCEVDE